MKFICYLCLLIFISSCSNKIKDPERYYNDELNVSIKNIEGWEIKENFNGIPVFFMSQLDHSKDNFKENVYIQKETSLEFSIDAYITNKLKIEAEEFEIIEEPSDIEINGESFKKVLFKHSQYMKKDSPFPSTVYTMIFVTKKGVNGYIINCTALDYTFDSFKPKFETLVNSFKFE